MTTALVDTTTLDLEPTRDALDLEAAITALLEHEDTASAEATERLRRVRRDLELELADAITG